MNLALQDAAELAEGLLAYYWSGDSARLGAHSSTRLPAIWQAVEFSHGMLQLLLLLFASQPGSAEATFHEGLRETRLTRLMNDEAFARAFALALLGQRVPLFRSLLVIGSGPRTGRTRNRAANRGRCSDY